MTLEEVRDVEFARLLVEGGDAKRVRLAAGRSRAEMVAASGGAFTVAALRSWEDHRRRPRSQTGAAYGRALRELVPGDEL